MNQHDTKPRVLVVDDEEEIRALIVRVLSAENFDVSSMPDGRAAVELLERESFDLIVTDVRMPHVSGIDVLRAAKKLSPSTEVIIMTGFGTLETAQEAVRLGAYDYLSKPLPNIKDVARIAYRAIEKKSMAEKNRELTEKLERMKNEFVSTVSHELRTPVAIIKSAISNLNDGILGNLTEKQKHVIESTMRNVDRLSRMVNDLLDLTRLESGRSSINKVDTDLTLLINEVTHTFKDIAEEKNIKLTVNDASSVPLVKADPDMLNQVLTNLVSNALRYAKGEIIIMARPTDEPMVEVVIENDGPVIQSEDMDDLFNKFVQVNRPLGGEGYKGTGLGLAICKEIIDLHGGRIWARSEPNKNVGFYFQVPEVPK